MSQIPHDLEPNKKKRGLSSNHPARVAQRILEKHPLVADDSGKVYRYARTHWVQASPQWLLNCAYRDLDGRGAEALASKSKIRAEVMALLRDKSYREGLVWGRVADDEIPALNGVLNLSSGTLRAHNKDDMLERVIPWRYDPAAKAPRWQAAVNLWFDESGGGESDKAAALQELFGYVCLSHARYKRAGVLYGDGDTAKSTVAKALIMLVGRENTCQLSVEFMDDSRRLAVIHGKALNIMTELPADALIKDGGFKTLVSTEEPVLIDPKYHRPYLYTPTAKHVVATNTLPRITDRSSATFNRLLIILFEQIIPKDQQDPDFLRKLEPEMSGVFAWAIEGARRLFENRGAFTVPESSARIIAEYREEQNPIVAFLRENCIQDAKAAVSVTALRHRFNKDMGGRPIGAHKFGRMLRAAVGERLVKNVRLREGPDEAACQVVVKGLVGYRFAAFAPSDRISVREEDAVSNCEEIEGA